MSSAKYLQAKMGSVIIDDQTHKHRLLHVLAHMDMNKKDFMLVLLDLLLKKTNKKTNTLLLQNMHMSICTFKDKKTKINLM